MNLLFFLIRFNLGKTIQEQYSSLRAKAYPKIEQNIEVKFIQVFHPIFGRINNSFDTLDAFRNYLKIRFKATEIWEELEFYYVEESNNQMTLASFDFQHLKDLKNCPSPLYVSHSTIFGDINMVSF